MTRVSTVLRAAWLLLLLLPVGALARDRPAAEHLPLPVLDLERYAGTWHHIAWLPEDFQRKCVRESRVEYVPRRDGAFDVHRRCVDADGLVVEETAEAVPVPGAPGSLQMRAAPRWRAWMPIGWKRRWVVAVDPAYQWAVVGSPDQDLLWIVSREPQMAPELLASLVEQARGMGYPMDELVLAPGAQVAGAAGTGAGVPEDLVVSTNEPFWQARVEGGVLQLSGPELAQPRRMQVDVEAPDRRQAATAGRRVRARDGHGEVVLEVTAQPCQDSMSGAWFPLAATLSVEGAGAVAGCARPAAMPPPGEVR